MDFVSSHREIPKTAGVYAIRHRITRDLYIGSSTNMRVRLSEHLRGIQRNGHTEAFVKLIDEHGADFEYAVVQMTLRSDRLAVEAEWIENLKPSLNEKPVVRSLSWRESATKFGVGCILASLQIDVPIEPHSLYRKWCVMNDTDMTADVNAFILSRIEGFHAQPPAKSKPRHK